MSRAQKRFLIFSLMALAIVLVAVLAPLIATHDPREAILANATQPPGPEHWFALTGWVATCSPG